MRAKKKTKQPKISSRTLTQLGNQIGHSLVPKIMGMADARGVSLPLVYSNVDVITKMAAQALAKKKKISWDLLSCDHQDAFMQSCSTRSSDLSEESKR